MEAYIKSLGEVVPTWIMMVAAGRPFDRQKDYTTYDKSKTLYWLCENFYDHIFLNIFHSIFKIKLSLIIASGASKLILRQE